MSDQSRKIQLEAGLDTRPVKQGFQEIVQAAESTASGVKSAADRAGKAVDGIGNGAADSAKKIETAERSIIASIQRRTAAVEAAGQSESKYYENLARQRGVNTDALRPYLAQLDAAKAKQDAAAASMGQMGVSAAQTAAALRGVPAQFTDIVTSLQGGQQPLTVLLQQGGQLKDMFGGAGNAAKALGGYIVGLVNPFTLAAGAIGAIGVAAFQGAEELQSLNKTLILTGGAAGVSGDRLMAVAAGIAAVNGNITQGKAVEALNALVDAGVRGEAQLGRYAKAAVEFERAGGGAAAEVAKQFTALGKDPLQASLKLNEAMNYLSTSTFETIRSLEAQGKTVEAARAAQDAYANAIETRTPALVQNIGLIETAWRDVLATMAGVWDQMKQIGRDGGLTGQLAGIGASLDTYQRLAAGGGLLGQFAAGKVTDLQAQQSDLRRKLAAQEFDARVAGQDARKREAEVAWLKFKETNLDKTVRVEREIASIRQRGIAAGASELDIQKEITRYRNANTPKARTSTGRAADPFAADRDAAKQWADYYKKFGDITAEAEGKVLGLSKAQQLLVEYLTSPAYKTNSEAMRQVELSHAYAAIAAEQAAEAFKKEQAAILAAANAFADRVEKEQGSAQAIAEQVRQQREATAAYGLSGQELVNLEVARLNDAAAEKDRLAAIADGIDPMYAEAYRDQAKALRELAGAKQNDASVRKQIDDYRNLWQGVESFAASAFMDVAENGESAFKRIGQSLKREVLQLLYEMTVKQWILNISGVGGGAGGSNSWLSMAAQSYMSGGSALGSSASAVGSWATGSMSTANAYGSLYANATGAGMDGLLATNGAYGTAGGGSAAAGSSAMTYAGYAALIVAAVAYAQKLYAQGYNREALGYGNGSTTRFGNYSSYQSDPRMGNSAVYNYADPGMSNMRRQIMDAVGMSQKWADIMSGSVRMAHLFGRRLTEVGLQADIVDGQTSVSGYAKYKGGIFRSNKTIGIEADSRDTAMLKAEVEALQNGTKAMAAAMGYSTEAVDHYTGKLKVNFKGVESNAEASERLQKAMDDLQFSMLKAAAGGKLNKAEFDKFMEGVKASIQAAGISVEGMSGILVNGMMKGLSGEEIGAQLSQMVIGGIYQTIAQQAFAPVAASIMAQIVTPVFTALAAGVPVAQAVSQMAIDNIVASAEAAAEALNAIFANAAFQEAMASLGEAFAGIGDIVGSIEVPSFDYQPIDQEAENRAREREQLEREILRLQGNTAELRRRELLDFDEANRARKEYLWQLEDEAAALDQVKELQNAWTDLTGSIEDEIKRLRNMVLADSMAGVAVLQAQFAIATGQARAMDQTAAGKLPGLSGQLAEAYLATSTSRSDYQARVNSLAASLEETNRITRGTAGIGTEQAQKVKDEELAAQIALLQKSVDALTNAQTEANKTTAATAKVLTQVTNNGNAMRTVSA